MRYEDTGKSTTCPRCWGNGHTVREWTTPPQAIECESCKGTGRIPIKRFVRDDQPPPPPPAKE